MNTNKNNGQSLHQHN
uniref:Uncharacterized protein n=1 Tax=Rhizophora mucronata TaxID=61149 RepID=A0A2P2II57_RHIMU